MWKKSLLCPNYVIRMYFHFFLKKIVFIYLLSLFCWDASYTSLLNKTCPRASVQGGPIHKQWCKEKKKQKCESEDIVGHFAASQLAKPKMQRVKTTWGTGQKSHRYMRTCNCGQKWYIRVALLLAKPVTSLGHFEFFTFHLSIIHIRNRPPLPPTPLLSFKKKTVNYGVEKFHFHMHRSFKYNIYVIDIYMICIYL